MTVRLCVQQFSKKRVYVCMHIGWKGLNCPETILREIQNFHINSLLSLENFTIAWKIPFKAILFIPSISEKSISRYNRKKVHCVLIDVSCNEKYNTISKSLFVFYLEKRHQLSGYEYFKKDTHNKDAKYLPLWKVYIKLEPYNFMIYCMYSEY